MSLKEFYSEDSITSGTTITAISYDVLAGTNFKTGFSSITASDGPAYASLERSTDGGTTWSVLEIIATPAAWHTVQTDERLPFKFVNSDKMRVKVTNKHSATQTTYVTITGEEI